MSLSPDDAKKIFAWFQKHPKATFEEFDDEFGYVVPWEYEESVLVKLSLYKNFSVDIGGWEYIPRIMYPVLVEKNPNVYIGDVLNMGGDLGWVPFNKLVERVVKDPYEIGHTDTEDSVEWIKSASKDWKWWKDPVEEQYDAWEAEKYKKQEEEAKEPPLKKVKSK